MEKAGLSVLYDWLRDFLEGIMPRNEAILLDVDADSISLIRAKMDKGLVVLSPIEEVSEGRTDGRRSGVIASFSRRNVVFRWLSFPTQEPHELDGMVRFEAADALPFTGKEAVYDYCRLSGTDDGYSRVLLAGTSRGKLEEFLGRAGTRGVRPGRVVPSSMALQALALAIPGAREGSTILVDATECRVETIALRQSDLLFAREAPRGDADDLQPVTSSIHMALEKLPHEEPLAVALHCSPKVEDAIRNELKSLSNCDIRTLDLISMQAELRIRVEGDVKITSKMAGLALMALYGCDGINLVPEEERALMRLRSRRMGWARKGVVAAACMLLFCIGSHAAMGRTERRIRVLETELLRMTPVAREVESKRAELKLISEQMNRNFSPFGLVMEIYRLTPSGVTVSQMNIDSQRGVMLHGQARALSQAFDYLAQLEDCHMVERAEARYAEKRPVGDKEIVDFEFFLTLQDTGHE